MPRLNNDEQFKFLISCIRYSNNGKVDFTEVAKECAIVTKGAAAKRYERMMKAHGIHQAICSRDSAVPALRRKDDPNVQGSKKRKHDQFDEGSNQPVDDDEGLGKVKDEVACTISDRTIVKDEVQVPEDTSADTDYPWLRYGSGTAGSSTGDDSSAFNEFIVAGGFEEINIPQSFETSGTVQSPQGGEESRAGAGDMAQQSILIVD
ncbi:hypothetical protein MMC26_003589 [Xylographa opegraphella]|nr:hypothetical protein [Xylographa opegraphella]